jgi:transient receptor potential cation channel subfamily V member 6
MEEDPFGLTAALDQMAFAQDIVMAESDTFPQSTAVVDMKASETEKQTELQKPQAQEVATTPSATTEAETDSKDPSSVTQASDKAQPTTTPTSTAAHSKTTTPARIPEKTFNDPLRDLILLSEVILIDDEEEFLKNVKSLAEDSSCLDYVLEVKSMDSYNQLQQQRKLDMMKSSSTLEQGISLFQNPKEIVDPVKEAEFLKTLEALEDTDDSDAVEKPVLGKISLVRRAKSAATRSSTDLRKAGAEENPIYNVAWEDIEVRKVPFVCF